MRGVFGFTDRVVARRWVPGYSRLRYGRISLAQLARQSESVSDRFHIANRYFAWCEDIRRSPVASDRDPLSNLGFSFDLSVHSDFTQILYKISFWDIDKYLILWYNCLKEGILNQPNIRMFTRLWNIVRNAANKWATKQLPVQSAVAPRLIKKHPKVKREQTRLRSLTAQNAEEGLALKRSSVLIAAAFQSVEKHSKTPTIKSTSAYAW